MLHQIQRFSSVALLLAAVGFVFTACDSDGGSSGPGTFSDGTADTLDIASMSPDDGADVESRAPTLKVSFTQKVAENEYTNTTTPRQDSETGDQGDSNRGLNRGLIDGIQLQPEIAKSGSKSLTVSNSIPVDIEWVDGRTALEVTVDTSDSDFDGLQDGYIYTLSLGDSGNDTGVYDKRFKSVSGSLFRDLDGDGADEGLVADGTGVNPTLDPEDLQFSVGLDEEAPAVPTVTFDPESGDVANESTLEDEVYDYTDGSITAPLQVSSVDNSGAQVKGYEVYYRSQNQVGRSGTGDTFVKAFEVSPEASSGDFEDWEGIIPVSAVNDDEFDDGELEFTATISDSPFKASDGSYGPVEWKFRAVSINGVRSEFTDVIETGDNTALDVSSAQITDTDDGDIEEITVTFNEPTQTSTVDAGDFSFQQPDDTSLNIGVSIADDGGDDPNDGDDNQDGTVVVLDITEDGSDTDDLERGDEIVVSDINDLAGNGLDENERTIN